MPKPSFDEVSTVKDPMLNDNYDISFPSVPGGGGDGRALRLQCKTAVKPGTNLAEVEVELFGHKLMHAARRTWSNEISVEFIEDNTGNITKILEAWAEVARATRTQHGAFKDTYAVNAKLRIYDQPGNVVMTYTLRNCWPSQVPDISFDGSGGAIITLGATFKFDIVERS